MATQKYMPYNKELGAYDYELSSTDQDRRLIDGSEEVALHLKQRLQFHYGEWDFDQSVGIAWIEHIFIKVPNKNLIDSLIKRTILTTPNVTSIVSYESQFLASERRFVVDFKYTDIFSEQIQSLIIEV